MFLHIRSWIVMVAAVVAVTCAACQSKPPAEPAPPETKQKTPPPVVKEKETPTSQPRRIVVDSAEQEAPPAKPTEKPAPKAAVHKPKPQTPPPAAIPKVALSDEIRATCLVKVGDTMPESELPDPAGKLHTLESLYGQKLTVVCLWTIGTTHRSHLVATAALQDLMRDVAEPFSTKGVRVVAINVGDAAAAVGKEVAQAGVTFPNLLDPKDQYFAKIAKDKRMPRTFLLGASGRVLWFDVEYSNYSRQELIHSIRVALREL